MLLAMTVLPWQALAQDKKEAEKPAAEKTGAKTEEKKAETPAEAPGRFAPEHCDFEITFPEKPAIAQNCVKEDDCFRINRYTMVYDLQTTIDITATCNPSTPENYKRYTDPVIKAALTGMIDSRRLSEHQMKYSDHGKGAAAYRIGSISGIGMTGAQEKIYSGQLWIGQNSVFTIQAELIGLEHPEADKTFAAILSSLKYKGGKQMPAPKAAKPNKTKQNNQ